MTTHSADKSKKRKKSKGGWLRNLLSPRSRGEQQKSELPTNEQPINQELEGYQNVFLGCASYLMNEEEFTETEGVFRVPGNAVNVDILTFEMINNKGKIPESMEIDSIHTIIGAMKGSIKQMGHIDQSLPSVQAFKKAIEQGNLDNSPELIQAVLDELRASKNEIDRNHADIIDAYIDLSVLASEHEDKTKMNPTNCGTVIMMTFDVYMLNMDPIFALGNQSKLGDAFAKTIQARLTNRLEADQSISSMEEEVNAYAEELLPRKSTKTAITPGQAEDRAKQRGQLQDIQSEKSEKVAVQTLSQPTQDETTKKTPRGKHTGKG